MIILYLISFIGGMLTLFSPCSGALLPMYLTVSFKERSKIFIATLVFSLGVVLITIPFGIGFSFFISSLYKYGPLVFQIFGIMLLAGGIYSLLGINPASQFTQNHKSKLNLSSVFGMGIFSGLSLGTCTGPIIGAIITISSVSHNLWSTFFMMLSFSFGIIAPLFIIAMGINKLSFLQNILVKGKLFHLNIFQKNIYIHSTNILVAIMFFVLAYVFYFHSGSFLSFSGSTFFNFMLDLQDKLLKVMYY